MVLDTIRTGFPNAQLNFHVNHLTKELDELIYDRIIAVDGTPSAVFTDHFLWIEKILGSLASYDSPICFVDGDIRFWSSVEDFDLSTPLTGMFIPGHVNEFFKAYYFARLHTSLLFIRSPKELVSLMKNCHPVLNIQDQERLYLRTDLIKPETVFIDRVPVAYDTCSKLYHTIGGRGFTEAELDCYDHLNSASFFKVMQGRFENEVDRLAFNEAHLQCEKNPDGMRGFWREVYDYYNTRAISLYDYLHYYKPR